MDLEAYSNNITNFIAGSYITSAIKLGKELGLFDELRKLDEPVSSQQLADACKLKERYVREWLGCMVSTKIVTVNDSGRYYIPQTLKPGIDAIHFTVFLPIVENMLDKAMDCFKKDGPPGYGYDEMPAKVIDVVEDRIANPDIVVRQLAVPVIEQLKSLTTILDLGCGAGKISRALGKRFPDADIYAADYCEAAITKASDLAKTNGIENVTYLKENVTSLPSEWTYKFDWVVLYDVLHDLPDPVNAMKEVYRVLKKDGVASIVDPDVHSNHEDNVGDNNVAGVAYAISSMVCLPCSLSTDGAAGNGIGWGSENKEAFLTSSGWRVLDKQNVDSHFTLNFTCVKSSPEN